MTKNCESSILKMLNRTSNSIRTTLIVLLIIFSLGLHGAAGLLMPDNDFSDEQRFNVESGAANDINYKSVINPVGYVFPGIQLRSILAV